MKFHLHTHPGYRAEDERLQSLKRDLAQARLDRQELVKRHNATRSIDAEVSAAMAGTPVGTMTATVKRDDIAQADHKLRVLQLAIERQTKVVNGVRAEASAAVLDKARPAYRAIVKRMYGILTALREACVEEEQFRRGLVDSDVNMESSFILPYFDCGATSPEHERQDSIARWIQQAREAEMI